MLCPIKVDLMRGEKPLVKLPANAWIAGGCCRRWFTGEPQNSDIDVFCKDAGVAGGVVSVNGMEEPGWKKFDSKMATTYRHDRRVIQIIKQPFDSTQRRSPTRSAIRLMRQRTFTQHWSTKLGAIEAAVTCTYWGENDFSIDEIKLVGEHEGAENAGQLIDAVDESAGGRYSADILDQLSGRNYGLFPKIGKWTTRFF